MSKEVTNSSSSRKDDQVERSGDSVLVQAEFSGPLPPPSILEKYENIVPGAAERILAEAESETRHRHEIEKALIAGYFRAKQQGSNWGGLVTIATLGCGTYLLATGHEIGGLAALIAAIVTPVAAFITGKFLPSKLPSRDEQSESE